MLSLEKKYEIALNEYNLASNNLLAYMDILEKKSVNENICFHSLINNDKKILEKLLELNRNKDEKNNIVRILKDKIDYRSLNSSSNFNKISR